MLDGPPKGQVGQMLKEYRESGSHVAREQIEAQGPARACMKQKRSLLDEFAAQGLFRYLSKPIALAAKRAFVDGYVEAFRPFMN